MLARGLKRLMFQAQGQEPREDVRVHRGPRSRLGDQDLQLLQKVRLQNRRHGSQFQKHRRGEGGSWTYGVS